MTAPLEFHKSLSFPFTSPSSSSSSSSQSPDFPRQISWSADGTVFFSQSDRHVLSLHHLQPNPADHTAPFITHAWSSQSAHPVHSALVVPASSSTDPENIKILSSAADEPVRLVHPSLGRTVASFSIENHQEVLLPASSMAVLPDQTLVCGHHAALEVFDLAHPAQGTRIKSTPSKKSQIGQKGILSALAPSPVDPEVVAAGSFSGSLALYDLRQPESVTPFRESQAGITALHFHPASGEILLCSSRRSCDIEMWDLRFPSSLPLKVWERAGDTNQRLDFAFSQDARYIVAGDTKGNLNWFDCTDEGLVASSSGPATSMSLGRSAVSCVAPHPWLPWVATACGSREQTTTGDSANIQSTDSDDSDSSDDSVASSVRQSGLDLERQGLSIWKQLGS